MLYNTDNLSNSEFISAIEHFVHNRHFGPYHAIVIRMVDELVKRLDEADNREPEELDDEDLEQEEQEDV